MKNLAIFTIFFCSATYTNAQLLVENKTTDSIPKTTTVFIPMLGKVQLNPNYTYEFQQAMMTFKVDSLVEQKPVQKAPKDSLKSTEKPIKKTIYMVQKETNNGGINQ